MKQNFKKPFHLLTSKSDLLPNLNVIYFNNGYMVASNTTVVGFHKLSEHIPEEEALLLDGFCITGKLFEILLKFESIQIFKGGVIEAKTKDDGVCIFQLDTFNLEDSKYQMPDFKKIIEVLEESQISKIGIDPQLLSVVEKVKLDKNSLQFIFNGQERAVILKDNAGFEKYLVMPSLLNNSLN